MKRAIRALPICLAVFLGLGACGDDATTVKAEPCGASKTYPKAPAGASAVVHVAKGCPADGADGSAAHPYGSIQQGLDATPDGGAVVVSPGDYGESFGTSKNVSVYGSDDGNDDPTAAAVSVSGVTTSTADTAQSGTVVVHGLKVQGAVTAAIWLRTGHLRVEACSVTGAKSDASGAYGFGILATGGTLEVDHADVEGSASYGVLVSTANATVTSSTVRGNGGGIRLQSATGTNVLDGNTIDGNVQLGVGVFGAQAKITGNAIGNVTATGKTDPSTGNIDDTADGIIVASPTGDPSASDTTVEISGNTISACERLGVIFSAGATGTIASNTIASNGGGASTIYGGGVWLQRGAGGDGGLMLAANTITGNHFVGVGLTSKARAQVMGNVAISSTIAREAFGVDGGSDMIGDGVQVVGGASAVVVGNAVEKNGRFGLIADGASGDSTSFQSNDVGENAAIGAVVQNGVGTAVDLAMNTYTNNGQGDSKVLGPTDVPFVVRTDEEPIAASSGVPQ